MLQPPVLPAGIIGASGNGLKNPEIDFDNLGELEHYDFSSDQVPVFWYHSWTI